ncbi:hypothetical protein HYU93_02985 [Candidatus Daviesbacteria bacterium]|nr:hypothetical protein [Candidatus Daviesbacteria bacterium]
MQEPAPKGIYLTDEDTHKLHNGVAKPVEQLTGHPVRPQSLQPIDESPLEKVAEEAGNKDLS